MKGLDKTKDLEIKSMEDLERIIEEADKFGMKLAVIGGYAVRAYTRGYRYTKDIDAVIQNEDRGGLVALLKSLGYDIRKTEFGIASSKKPTRASLTCTSLSAVCGICQRMPRTPQMKS